MHRTEGERILDLEVRVGILEKIASEALTRSLDAHVKVEAMKQSTHKVELINPYANETLEESKKEEEVPQSTPKLSPFNTFQGFKARRQSLEDANKIVEEAIEPNPFEMDAFGEV